MTWSLDFPLTGKKIEEENMEMKCSELLRMPHGGTGGFLSARL